MLAVMVPMVFSGSTVKAENRVLTCYLRLPLRVEGVGPCVEIWPGALSGNGHPHPHPLELTEAVREEASLGRVLEFLAMPCGHTKAVFYW